MADLASNRNEDRPDMNNDWWNSLETPRSQGALLGLILIIGLLLRLYGIDFGLPFRYDPDEWHYVGMAAEMLATKDPNPHWFGHPGTTTVYMNALLYGVFYATGRVLGYFSGTEDFKALYFQNPTLFYLGPRILITLFAVASIAVFHGAVRRVFSGPVALSAAALFAAAPLHIDYSKIVRTDIEMTFFVLVSLWFALKIYEHRAWSAYLLAGFFTGVAVATKYPAVVISLSIFIAHLTAPRSAAGQEHGKLFASAGASLVGAFLCSPFLFIDFGTALTNITGEARSSHLSHTGEGLLANLGWYFQFPLSNSFTWLGVLLAFVGFIALLRYKNPRKWVFIIYPTSFLLFISLLNLRWSRWIIPLVPFMALFIALGIRQVVILLRPASKPLVSSVVGIALFSIVFGMQVRTDLAHGHSLTLPDTRTITREWMLQNIPRGSKVLMEVYGPQLPKGAYDLYEVNRHENRLENIDPERTRHQTEYPHGIIGRIEDPTEVEREGVQYMVITNMLERFTKEHDAYGYIVDNYNYLISQGELIFETKSIEGKTNGPRIRIFSFRR